MKKEERFVKTYSRGRIDHVEIFVDKQTGVNYVYRAAGYTGGLTVLVDANGDPVITPLSALEE